MVKVNPLIKSLQEQIAALEARIADLERPVKLAAEAAKSQASAPVSKPAPVPQVQEQISEETMLVIAAAVAAYFGERAHIRVVRLVPSHAWAQQGRVSIQASHQLA
jgi:methylmalonyl-CoA carboxyltransferase large subunit